MKRVRVIVTLKAEVSDPQGTVITHALHTLGYKEIDEVRCGKYFEISVPDDFSEEEIKEICQKVLSNPVIEDFKILS